MDKLRKTMKTEYKAASLFAEILTWGPPENEAVWKYPDR
jgi:hypothetical protein